MPTVRLLAWLTILAMPVSATVVVTDPTLDHGGNDWHGDLRTLEYRDAPTTLNVLLRNNGILFNPDPTPGPNAYESVFLFDVTDGNGTLTKFRIDADADGFRLLRDGQDISDRIQFSGTPRPFSYQMLLNTQGLLGGQDLVAGDQIINSVAWLNSTGTLGSTADRAPDTGVGQVHTFLGEGDSLIAFEEQGVSAPGAAWWQGRWAAAFVDGPDNGPDNSRASGVYVVIEDGEEVAEHRVFAAGSADFDERETSLYADDLLHLLVDPRGDGTYWHASYNGTDWIKEELPFDDLGSQVWATPWLRGNSTHLVALVQTDDDRLAVHHRNATSWSRLHTIDARMGHLAVNEQGAHVIWLDEDGQRILVSQQHLGWNQTVVVTDIDERWFDDRDAVDDGGFAIATEPVGDRVAVMWEDGGLRFAWLDRSIEPEVTDVKGDGGNPVTRLRMAIDGHGNIHASGGYYGLNFVAVRTDAGWERESVQGRDLHAMDVAYDGSRILSSMTTSTLRVFVHSQSPFGDLEDPRAQGPDDNETSPEGCDTVICADGSGNGTAGKKSPLPFVVTAFAVLIAARRR